MNSLSIGRLAALLLLLATLIGSLSAQVRVIPNTGCPNSRPPQTAGNPAIGQGFGVICPPPSTPGGTGFVVLGLGPAAIDLGPLGCARNCILACRPVDIVAGSAWRVLIPNDRNLIGACICVQCGALEIAPTGRACVDLAPALQVCITR